MSYFILWVFYLESKFWGMLILRNLKELLFRSLFRGGKFIGGRERFMWYI